MMNKLCGHCGSEVKEGFKVCASCGANFRQELKFVGYGLLFGIFGLVAFEKSIIAGLIMLGIAGFVIYVGLQKKWYRKND